MSVVSAVVVGSQFVVVWLIGSAVVVLGGLAVVRSVEQSLSANEFGMGIATSYVRGLP